MTALEPSPFRLTELTDCGGCAAKLGADLLAEALAGLGAEAAAAPDASLIAGLNPPDDAAVYRISDDLAIIGTLDFFPPLVDDPRTFGEIAAANALSDVFAMGGRVLFALSIAAFPEDLPRDVLTEIFAGASSKVREAGGTLAGGHTIRDPEPKYGLAVIGAAHPDKLLRKGGARPGDRLVLTKPLGTGVLVSGSRQGRTSDADLADRDRRDAPAQPRGIGGTRRDRHPCRDRRHRLRPAGPRPRDGPGIRHAGSCSMRATCPRSPARSLLASAASRPAGRPTIDDSSPAPSKSPPAWRRSCVTLAHDPQTSGGLLAAIPTDRLADVEAALEHAEVPHWRIGHVEASDHPGVSAR